MPGKICRAACKGCRVRRPMRLRKTLSRKRLPQVWRWPAGCRSAEARSCSAEALLCRVSPQISLPFSLRSIPSGSKRPQLEPKPTPGSSRPCSMLPPPRRRHLSTVSDTSAGPTSRGPRSKPPNPNRHSSQRALSRRHEAACDDRQRPQQKVQAQPRSRPPRRARPPKAVRLPIRPPTPADRLRNPMPTAMPQVTPVRLHSRKLPAPRQVRHRRGRSLRTRTETTFPQTPAPTPVPPERRSARPIRHSEWQRPSPWPPPESRQLWETVPQ
jgi:hypothetical protein